MQRRQMLRVLGGAALAPCLIFRGAVQGQQPAHVGFIGGGAPSASTEFLNAFRSGLAALGYSEPTTLRFKTVFAEQALDRIPTLVEELEHRGVRVIVTHAQATVPVVKSRRRTPVVYQFSADPVAAGIADSLAHPRYNATGVTLLAAELNSKRLELLREINPNSRRLAVMFNPLHPGEHLERAWIDDRCQSLGIDVAYYPTSNRDALNRSLDLLKGEELDGVLLLPDGFIAQNGQAIIDFALRQRLPIISGWSLLADAGALLTYGPRLVEAYRRSAYYVDRILRGEEAAALPIERPTALELVVNLNTALRLGLTLPPTILAQADRVVE